jgi:hypothetical protein
VLLKRSAPLSFPPSTSKPCLPSTLCAIHPAPCPLPIKSPAN